MSHEKAELLPCPFCGGKAKYRPDHTVERIDTVSCLRCDFYLSDSGDIGSCVEGWNRRAPLSAIVPDEVAGLVRNLTKIADASRREDGTDIPLGEQVRKAASTLTALAARAEKAERERAEQWRLRRDAEGSRDAVMAANDVLRTKLAKALREAEEAQRMQRAVRKDAMTADNELCAAEAHVTTLEAELSALRARLEEAGKVIERWVSWCDDWHAGKPHPSDDLAAARRFLEEVK